MSIGNLTLIWYWITSYGTPRAFRPTEAVLSRLQILRGAYLKTGWFSHGTEATSEFGLWLQDLSSTLVNSGLGLAPDSEQVSARLIIRHFSK